jgi:hypothetical protein
MNRPRRAITPTSTKRGTKFRIEFSDRHGGPLVALVRRELLLEINTVAVIP